ncbi:glycerate kinase, partial [Staphylococcus haemolyticus]|uniref:glycerate kinase n=1 Tax=Staphylococcus haemolyticus TaxID=1283 RepID=UPI001C5EF54E
MNLEGLDSRLQNVQVIGLADVDNPLTGKNGATQIFGPQKGVRSNQVAEFDKRLNRLSQLTTKV